MEQEIDKPSTSRRITLCGDPYRISIQKTTTRRGEPERLVTLSKITEYTSISDRSEIVAQSTEPLDPDTSWFKKLFGIENKPMTAEEQVNKLYNNYVERLETEENYNEILDDLPFGTVC